jgi:hypothetical protein
MEIEMKKQRKGNKGLIFEGNVDLSHWDLFSIDRKMENAFDDFETIMEETIKKARNKIEKAIGNTESRIKTISSEVVQIAIEEDLIVGFWEIETNPEKLTIHLSEFAEDGYHVHVDIKQAIHELLMDHCAKDGYVDDSSESKILNFASMLDDISHELKTSIRPKEKI